MRLKLKDKQSREIIHVLMDCSLQVFKTGFSRFIINHYDELQFIFIYRRSLTIHFIPI